jgi:Mrp family chromosome partitioning ATPase
LNLPVTQLQSYDENSSEFGEYYQLFRKLKNISNNKNGQIVLFTSAIAEEGRTTISSFASKTCSLAMGDYCLLVNSNFKKANFHQKNQQNSSIGFSDILTKKIEYDLAVKESGIARLHYISAGSPIKSTLSAQAWQKAANILNILRTYYKFIVIDSPPVLESTYTLRLAELVDSVLLIIRVGQTPRKLVKRSVKILKESQCNFDGLILNDTKSILI